MRRDIDFIAIHKDLTRLNLCSCNWCAGNVAANGSPEKLALLEGPLPWSWKLCGMPTDNWGFRRGPCKYCPPDRN